jgi:tetratricopeptide (TPR) repeat protein
MQVSIDQAQESIGLALLPILEKLLPILEDVATFVAENTELFIAAGVAIGALSTIVIAYNAALKVKAAATGIATAAQWLFNKTMEANPAVRIAMIILTLVGVLFVLEKKFGVVTKVLEAGKIVMDKLGDAVRWLAGKFVDFINTLIDVANKIPFVDIGKLTNVFEEQAKIVEDEVTPAIEGYADAELEVAEAIAEAAYQQQLANLDYEEAERLMDELHPTLDDVTAAIGRTNDAMARHHEAQQFISDMNTDLIDEFNYLFGIFDNDKAVDNFSDAILDAAEAVREYGEGSREAEEASRDIYRELGKVIDQLDNIPATKQLELIALLDQGEYDAVLAQLEVLNAIANTALTTLTAAEIAAAAGMLGGGNFAPAPPLPTPVSSVQIGPSSRSGVRGGDMNVTVNMPAGTDPNELVRVLERAGRQSGSLPIPTTGQIRS